MCVCHEKKENKKKFIAHRSETAHDRDAAKSNTSCLQASGEAGYGIREVLEKKKKKVERK